MAAWLQPVLSVHGWLPVSPSAGAPLALLHVAALLLLSLAAARGNWRRWPACPHISSRRAWATVSSFVRCQGSAARTFRTLTFESVRYEEEMK